MTVDEDWLLAQALEASLVESLQPATPQQHRQPGHRVAGPPSWPGTPRAGAGESRETEENSSSAASAGDTGAGGSGGSDETEPRAEHGSHTAGSASGLVLKKTLLFSDPTASPGTGNCVMLPVQSGAACCRGYNPGLVLLPPLQLRTCPAHASPAHLPTACAGGARLPPVPGSRLLAGRAQPGGPAGRQGRAGVPRLPLLHPSTRRSPSPSVVQPSRQHAVHDMCPFVALARCSR